MVVVVVEYASSLLLNFLKYHFINEIQTDSGKKSYRRRKTAGNRLLLKPLYSTLCWSSRIYRNAKLQKLIEVCGDGGNLQFWKQQTSFILHVQGNTISCKYFIYIFTCVQAQYKHKHKLVVIKAYETAFDAVTLI